MDPNSVLKNLSFCLFAAPGPYQISDFADGDSEALRRRVLEAISTYNENLNVPSPSSKSMHSKSFELEQGESPPEAAVRISGDFKDYYPQYVVIALEDGQQAVAIAEELQKVLDNRCGAASPVVLGIKTPILMRFSN